MAKKCPLFTHALAISGGLSCYGSNCQMWDAERADCGLKHPAPQSAIKPGIDPKYYFKGEPPPSEPE